MDRNRRFIAFTVVALVALVVGLGVVAQASGVADSDETIRLRVVERAITDTFVDVGKSGDSEGDLLTYHNPIFDEENEDRVGHNEGSCIRIAPDDGIWQCSFTTFLDGGQITVEGPFYDDRDSVFAITGGTRTYKSAHGTMLLLHREDPAEFGFVFRIVL